MTPPALDLTRRQILAFRRHAGALDARLPAGPTSLHRAAWAGLQDSMPRAALLSLHARVEGSHPTLLDHPSLIQLWGPRYSVYVVAARDRAIFTLGRRADGAKARLGEALADRLQARLGDGRMPFGEAGRALGVEPNRLRYAAPTGRVLLRWDGARQPTIWIAPPPDVDPEQARLELARRYLHVFGPATPRAFATWAGIAARQGIAIFEALGSERTRVRMPIGRPGSWPGTRPRCVPRRARRRPPDCSPAATPTPCSRAPTASCWSRTPRIVASSGRRGSGRAPCSWTARSSAAGGARRAG